MKFRPIYVCIVCEFISSDFVLEQVVETFFGEALSYALIFAHCLTFSLKAFPFSNSFPYE